ncbi:MAG TPA: YneF family protein [Sporosarcina sp.]|nr:YneF family protein [Sporosarcina sp.]
MSTIWWILIIIVALVAGVALGFFIARQYMMKYLEENPPINEEMLRMMMMQMGQKPSQKRINQMMNQMNKVSEKKDKKAKKKS